MIKLSWKPVRRGRIYCASGCGGDCSYHDYRKAKRLSASLARKMGPAWKPHVWENLGWHWSIICGSSSIRPNGDGTYWADVHIGRQFMATHRNPKAALLTAVRASDEAMESWIKDRAAFRIAQQGGR